MEPIPLLQGIKSKTVVRSVRESREKRLLASSRPSVRPYMSTRLPEDGGTRWRSWLRHRTISRKVAGSIPNGVIGMFN
jgi:hypothetical protein